MIRRILLESLRGTTAKPTHTGSEASPAPIRKPNPNTASHRFHFSNFRYSFTLFSKFFASFPHGTCSLSVSHQYLALDGIYHPLRAAIPNNSTRRKLKLLRGARTGLSPSTALHSRRLRLPCDLASPDDNSEDYTSELFPLHSPLLRESLLVSFPPPSYMLKFSG
jgi:hypothetical protein